MGQGRPGVYARRRCRPVEHGVSAPFPACEFQRLADLHAAREVALGEGDFVGAYNAFRQAYGYDPVNELAVSEMERMLRLQA